VLTIAKGVRQVKIVKTGSVVPLLSITKTR